MRMAYTKYKMHLSYISESMYYVSGRYLHIFLDQNSAHITFTVARRFFL